MEATRATPRPSCARRVLARKRPRLDDAPANSARKLQRREVAAGPGRAFSSRFTRGRFRNIQLQRAQSDAGFPLSETESLELPGFVEFDDGNDKVVTFSAQNSLET
ncbi:hypothetical protein PR202_gb04408 [Eleusine coracana subsp. coracana]|uniref:Uncharacterized protein n=1 Tax=Eleusine coracana subsp. coracana TaxID=191504 RepID=A0AAV5E5A5_ELECO|nr:hypothetical protein PR202_gb04408 [Eleusine coracana subsp. coracana]